MSNVNWDSLSKVQEHSDKYIINQKISTIVYTVQQFIHNGIEIKEKEPWKRKHGSKWKKHRERGIKYFQDINDRVYEYGINYPLLFNEVFGLELKEKWNWYIWLCPFHNDNNPSLSIHLGKNCLKCFWCGTGWSNIFSFFIHWFNFSVDEAYKTVQRYIFSPEESKKWKQHREEKKAYYDSIDKNGNWADNLEEDEDLPF